jgi:hypothetical protein
LAHCHEANSLTWQDDGIWTRIEPRKWSLQQVIDSIYEIGFDPGNARYQSVWIISFINRIPHFAQPLSAKTVGDFHEALLAFFRLLRQDRWESVRRLGFTFTPLQLTKAAQAIEELCLAHWHYFDADGGAAQRMAPPDEPSQPRGRSGANNQHNTRRSRSPLQHGVNTAPPTQAPTIAQSTPPQATNAIDS